MMLKEKAGPDCGAEFTASSRGLRVKSHYSLYSGKVSAVATKQATNGNLWGLAQCTLLVLQVLQYVLQPMHCGSSKKSR